MTAAISDLKPLLQPIVDQAARLLNVIDVGLYLYDPDRGVVRLIADHSEVDRLESFVGVELALGEGLAGRAVQRREPIVTSDYHSTEHRPDVYQDMPWRSAMGIPLIADGEMLGALSVADTSQDRTLTERDIELVHVFAEQAAVTLSNAQKLTQERHWSESLRRLNEISRQLRRHQTDLSTLLSKVVDAASELLDVKTAVLYLFDPRTRTLSLAASNEPIADERVELELNEGLSGQVAQSREPITVYDYQTWPYRTEKWKVTGVHSVLGVPLMYGEQLLGVLDVGHDEKQAFADEDVQSLQLLADQAALSIEQAQRSALHSRFQDIREKMLQTTERSGLDDILENVAQSLAEYSPFKVAMISVFDRPVPLYHAVSPTIQDIYIAGLPSDQANELRRHVKAGRIISNDRIAQHGLRIGDAYYITPDDVPEVEQVGVPIDPNSNAEQTRQAWGNFDNFYYFLYLNGRVIGRISLSDPIHGLIPTADELEPVEGFVSFAAVAVQRARYQERIETLYRISQDLGRTDSLEVLYDKALALIQDLFPFDYAAMNRADPEARQIRLVSQKGLSHCPFRVGDTISFRQGVCGWVATQRRAERLDDVTQDERHIQGDVAMRSELTVPIELGDCLLGVLNLESTQTHAYTDEDCQLLEALSDQLAVAISNLERRKQLEEFQSRLYGVYSLSERLAHIEDLDDLCAQAVDLIHENFPYDYVVILTLEGERLVRRGFRSQLPQDELIEENFQSLTLDRGITGWSARHKTPVLVNDVTQSANYIPGHPDIQSELAMPIAESGQVLGVLNIESTRKDAFSRDDQELLKALARQLGVAMRSIERRTRVEELNDFLRELNEIEGVDALLERVLKRVISLMHPKAEGGSVMFYDEQSDQFGFRIAVGRDIDELKNVTYSADELHQILDTDRPTFLTASDQVDHPVTGQLRDQLPSPPPASTLSLPIQEHDSGRVIAILHINNFHDEGVFAESDADLLLDLREEITAALLRARDREQLRELATRDALTGAYNRHFLNAFLQQERKRSERYANPLSLVMIDINGFYEVNDRFGHAEGDRVLRELAQLLLHNVRAPDRVVRYGGDEFVIIMPETQEEEAKQAMARIEDVVRNWDPGLDDLRLGFSFGVASWTPDNLKSPVEILNEADAFMYRRRTSPERRRAHKREISRPDDDVSDESTGPPLR